MLLQRGTGSGNEHREQENVEWEQNRDLEMKLLTGLGFELGFVPIFHFPVSRIGSLLPVSRSSNIRKCLATEVQTCQLD